MYYLHPLPLPYSSYRHFDKHKIICNFLLYHWYPQAEQKHIRSHIVALVLRIIPTT